MHLYGNTWKHCVNSPWADKERLLWVNFVSPRQASDIVSILKCERMEKAVLLVYERKPYLVNEWIGRGTDRNGAHAFWALLPSPPLFDCVNLGKLLDYSVPQFGDNYTAPFYCIINSVVMAVKTFEIFRWKALERGNNPSLSVISRQQVRLLLAQKYGDQHTILSWLKENSR